MDNYVKKSGDTMSGNLIIEKSNSSIRPELQLMCENTTEDNYFAGSIVMIRNNLRTGYIESGFDANLNRAFTQIVAHNIVNEKDIYYNIGTFIKPNGEFGTYAPLCKADGSIIITVSHGDTWIRFGNGIQICWGYVGPNEQLITFPQPFKDTLYSITVTGGNVKNEPQATMIRDDTRTTTNVKVYCAYLGKNYMIIGYWY